MRSSSGSTFRGGASLAGVHGIYTAADLAADGLGPMPCMAAVKPLIVPPRPALADGRVRHVGDPVAFVVADSEEIAREAAELIEVDYESLPAVVDGMAALAAGAPAIWEEAPGNLAFHVAKGDAAAVAQAMKEAAHVVEIEVMNNRVVVAPIEPRAGIARYDAATETMDLELTGQGLHGIRRQLAEFVFKVPLERIQLHAPDVGGGFGMKNFLYPEWMLLLWAARKLGRPVRWLADRAEEFVTARAGPRHRGHGEAGARRDGPHPGARRGDGRQSRRLSFGQRARRLGRRGLDGAGRRLRHPAIAVDVRGAFTNTVPVDAYRGAGKPEANYIIERAIEAAARQLGRDPAELRRQNLIAAFPHKTAIGMAINSGGFVANLDAAVARADTAGFEARRAAAKARGRLRGIGVACFLETSRGAPNEGAEVRFESDGTVTVAVGTESNGQGHETAFAQIAADRLGVPMEAIRYVQADTRAGEERRRPWRRALDAYGRRGGGEGDRCGARQGARPRGPSFAGVGGRAGLRRRTASRCAAATAPSPCRRWRSSADDPANLPDGMTQGLARARDEHDRRLHLPERLPCRRGRDRSRDRRGRRWCATPRSTITAG